MCKISKVIGIDERKEIGLQNKGYIDYQRCERTDMAVNCQILVTVNKHFIGICKKKYDCQTRNTQLIMDVNGQIWLSM